MTHHLSIPRPVVALACLSVLAAVGHGPVPAPESHAASASAFGSASEVASDPSRAPASSAEFFGAPFSADELPGLLNRLSVAPDAGPVPQVRSRRPDGYYDFYFTRAVYGGGGLGSRGFFGRGSWAVDYPKADRQFLVVLGETLDLLRVPSMENAVRLEDPRLREYPFLYTLEVGGMRLTPEQVEGLRNYLLAGGFLVVDDFWGAWEWRNFEEQMRRVFPGVEFVDLPLDHEIFHVFYDIEEILQVPNVNNAAAGVTSECGPCQPHVRGIFDDDGRLMVVINWNTDLGDAWEWSEQAVYPFKYSNFAYKMAVNFIVYAMTH